MSSALEGCLEEIKAIQRDAETITEASDVAHQLKSSVAGIGAIQEQFIELLKRTGYIQHFASSKQHELDSLKERQDLNEKDEEGNRHKISYLEVRKIEPA